MRLEQPSQPPRKKRELELTKRLEVLLSACQDSQKFSLLGAWIADQLQQTSVSDDTAVVIQQFFTDHLKTLADTFKNHRGTALDFSLRLPTAIRAAFLEQYLEKYDLPSGRPMVQFLAELSGQSLQTPESIAVAIQTFNQLVQQTGAADSNQSVFEVARQLTDHSMRTSDNAIVSSQPASVSDAVLLESIQAHDLLTFQQAVKQRLPRTDKDSGIYQESLCRLEQLKPLELQREIQYMQRRQGVVYNDLITFAESLARSSICRLGNYLKYETTILVACWTHNFVAGLQACEACATNLDATVDDRAVLALHKSEADGLKWLLTDFSQKDAFQTSLIEVLQGLSSFDTRFFRASPSAVLVLATASEELRQCLHSVLQQRIPEIHHLELTTKEQHCFGQLAALLYGIRIDTTADVAAFTHAATRCRERPPVPLKIFTELRRLDIPEEMWQSAVVSPVMRALLEAGVLFSKTEFDQQFSLSTASTSSGRRFL